VKKRDASVFLLPMKEKIDFITIVINMRIKRSMLESLTENMGRNGGKHPGLSL